MAVLVNLHTYSRLTYEAPVAEVRFQERSPQHFWAYVTFGRAEAMIFDIWGDEWQLDARVLKRKGTALLLGFDTLFRLDRLNGRYRDVFQERTQPRSVYSLLEAALVWIFGLLCKETHGGFRGWMRCTGMQRTCPWPTGTFCRIHRGHRIGGTAWQ